MPSLEEGWQAFPPHRRGAADRAGSARLSVAPRGSLQCCRGIQTVSSISLQLAASTSFQDLTPLHWLASLPPCRSVTSCHCGGASGDTCLSLEETPHAPFSSAAPGPGLRSGGEHIVSGSRTLCSGHVELPCVQCPSLCLCGCASAPSALPHSGQVTLSF